jgi:hypothetical protein
MTEQTTLGAMVDQIDAQQRSLQRQVGWTWAAIVALTVLLLVAGRHRWQPA